jgi:restriction endonuclease Mrr
MDRGTVQFLVVMAGLLVTYLAVRKALSMLEEFAKTRRERRIREQQEIDQTRRRQRVAEEQQRRIKERQDKLKADASRLQHKERRRLTQSFIPTLDELLRLSPQRFEDVIAHIFKEDYGYEVEQTPYVKDHGRDAILSLNGFTYLLECKKWVGTVGRRELQILHSAIMTGRAQSGIFVTTGTYSRDAVEFAPTVPIDLADGARLAKMFENRRKLTNNDKYCSMCRECGDIVSHRLRASQVVPCREGHPVLPTLYLSTSGVIPACPRCGLPMHKVQGTKGRKRPFWGCTGYPECRGSWSEQ